MANKHSEGHRIGIGGWLRAAVLGANDGVVSIASLVVGVAAADASSAAILTAGLAGLVGGALSMAVGEYVSVSSQRDVEEADLERERRELRDKPDRELAELTALLRAKGLTAETARVAARELTAHDALAAHAAEELGLQLDGLARPLQAASVSALAFALGASLPLLAIGISPVATRSWITAAATLIALAGLGAWSGRLGGAPVPRAILRVVVGGALAMGLTAALGGLFGGLIG
ncbi:MAG: VIT family protein [Acidobacteriota bacterium]|nr:VIT family protein [Acidobacteriota bacterium]MDH3522913.1 VIT family protein [Acidobacteriota bacterium]